MSEFPSDEAVEAMKEAFPRLGVLARAVGVGAPMLPGPTHRSVLEVAYAIDEAKIRADERERMSAP